MRGLIALVVLTSACHVTVSDGNGTTDADPNAVDSPQNIQGDGGADAYVLGAWSTPTLLAPGNTTAAEDDGTIAWNGNELIFARVDGTGVKHLYYASRPDAQSAFGTAALLTNSAAATELDESPRFADDDLTLYFGSTRAPNTGGSDLWMMTRPSIGGAWSTPTKITTLASATTEKWLATCSTGYFLMVRNDATGADLYDGTNLASPTKVDALNSTAAETGAYLSQDCLTAFFASTRDGTNDLWTSTRATVTAAWSPPTKLAFSTTANAEQDPWMSKDQRTFVFASNAAGNNDLYISTR
jgi:hypothetical protein